MKTNCLIVLALLISCSRNNLTDNALGPVKKEIGSSVTQEAFKEFMIRFGTDSVFQASRVKFPVHFEAPDDTGESLREGTITEKEWRFIPFGEDSEYNKPPDAFVVVIDSSKADTVMYHRRGIDNGINETYQFVMEGNIWLLSAILDRSS